MDIAALLTELFDRIDGHVTEAVDGLDASGLNETISPGTNSIGWLVWHLSRVQDHHVSELIGEPQVWTTSDWASRFGVEADPDNTGYGHDADDVASIRPEDAAALTEYYEAVAARTFGLLQRTTADDLDRVVDERWDPPVTLGVRLISVADDDIQHAGQAAFLRGLLDARR
jgi:uncharacterized damage-inducible protein DinB